MTQYNLHDIHLSLTKASNFLLDKGSVAKNAKRFFCYFIIFIDLLCIFRGWSGQGEEWRYKNIVTLCGQEMLSQCRNDRRISRYAYWTKCQNKSYILNFFSI